MFYVYTSQTCRNRKRIYVLQMLQSFYNMIADQKIKKIITRILFLGYLIKSI